jgi:hypothetical protein
MYEPMTVELIEKIFASTEEAETQFEKDVCDFNPVDAVEFLRGLGSKSRRRLQSTCIRLSKYYEWCKNVEHLTTNIINPFDSRGIDIVIDGIIPLEDLNQKFFTKQRYLEMLNEVVDVSNKFISYAFYCGLTNEEIANLKIEDLDFDNNMVHLVSGRDLKVDSLFKNLMIQTNDQTQYFPDGIEKENRNKMNNYADSEYVVRSCDKNVLEPVSKGYIAVRVRVIKEQMENNFVSIPTLYINGLINYIKEQYAKRDINLKSVFLDKVDSRIYKHDEETQKYINEFGSQKTVRFLRMEIKDYLDLL